MNSANWYFGFGSSNASFKILHFDTQCTLLYCIEQLVKPGWLTTRLWILHLHRQSLANVNLKRYWTHFFANHLLAWNSRSLSRAAIVQLRLFHFLIIMILPKQKWKFLSSGWMEGWIYWCCHRSEDCSMNIKLELQLNIFAKIAYYMVSTMPPEQKHVGKLRLGWLQTLK